MIPLEQKGQWERGSTRHMKIATKVSIYVTSHPTYLVLINALTAVKHLRTLLTLVVTNSEVRKLLGDFSIVGRDLLARGAGKAANAIAPSASALEGVDQPAPDNEFMTEGGRTVGSDETPVLEANVPGVGGVKADPHSGSAQAFRDGGEDGQRQPIGEVGGLTDAKNKARNLKGSVKGGARDKMGSLKGEGMQQAREAQQATEAGDEGAINEKKGGMMGKMKQFRVRNPASRSCCAIPMTLSPLGQYARWCQ